MVFLWSSAVFTRWFDCDVELNLQICPNCSSFNWVNTRFVGVIRLCWRVWRLGSASIAFHWTRLLRAPRWRAGWTEGVGRETVQLQEHVDNEKWVLYDWCNDRSPFADILQELSMQLPVCWVCYAWEYRFVKRFMQISWRGIRIGNECFQWVYSLQSQRNHACVPSSFESQAIEAAIRRRSVCLKQERCVVV